ncbi:FAD-dependent oxidoreductase [Micromonospora sp. NBRC 101691]|uniref:flavin monoamine oxidase family protein n=1 Tax=Micromonospora sp. NBRC 101691 TaxID=3032198 RepID=UPI0024A1ECFA|nr:FAD-dependent oxidoreductase [Micromonospora sp. NBRC 101691]GLY22182.1 flavin monoamine oxidase [Micromonospora sp. NBRC 101691]
MSQTRRDFLRRVGIAGGAGVMLHSMGALGLTSAHAAETPPFTPLKKSDLGRHGRKTVIVMGGGIAGLTAAYELLKGGYHVTVLEGRDRPGGRNWTVRGGDTFTDLKGRTQKATFAKGQYMNAGPGRIPQMHVTLDYCRELGVPIEVFTNANADAFLYRENVPGALNGVPVRQRAVKADAYGYTAELLAKATDQGSLDQYLTAEDKERLLSYLRSFGAIGSRVAGDPAASFKYNGGGRRGYDPQPGAGLEAGTPIPAYAMSDLFASTLGNYFSFEMGFDQAMMMYQPVGGMDRIAHALAKAVGAGRLRYNARIVEYHNTADGVEVVYTTPGGTKKVVGDFAINTMPPHIAAKIKSNLPAAIVTALGSVSVTNAGKIGIEYDRRWWEEDFRIYGGITNANTNLANMWHPSYGYHGERGTMIGYYNTGANANFYGNLTPPQRLAEAVTQGKKIFGDVYGKGITASFSQDWASTPFSEGAWVGWPGAVGGQTGAGYRSLLEPTGNVYFAGDHLSHAIAWQHGAMVSARVAVESLHTRVTAA